MALSPCRLRAVTVWEVICHCSSAAGGRTTPWSLWGFSACPRAVVPLLPRSARAAVAESPRSLGSALCLLGHPNLGSVGVVRRPLGKAELGLARPAGVPAGAGQSGETVRPGTAVSWVWRECDVVTWTAQPHGSKQKTGQNVQGQGPWEAVP